MKTTLLGLMSSLVPVQPMTQGYPRGMGRKARELMRVARSGQHPSPNCREELRHAVKHNGVAFVYQEGRR